MKGKGSYDYLPLGLSSVGREPLLRPENFLARSVSRESPPPESLRPNWFVQLAMSQVAVKVYQTKM